MDPKCCNAYVSAEKAAQNWGDAAADNEAKIQKAVRETDGYVALYVNQPMLAVFHSSSAGKTESSGDVWSSNLPYLVGVTSPENADTVSNYYSTATFAAVDFKAAFLAAYPAADLSGAPDTWCKDLIKNGSDRVEKITVGGVTVTGVPMMMKADTVTLMPATRKMPHRNSDTEKPVMPTRTISRRPSAVVWNAARRISTPPKFSPVNWRNISSWLPGI